MIRKRLAIPVFLWVASSCVRASAQPTSADRALAIQLFDDAEKLKASGNLAAACPKYGESQKRDPQLGTLLHLADCHEKVGKTASAWAEFKDAAEIAARRNAAGGNERREQVARQRAAALASKVSSVVIHVAEPETAGLEIREGGEVLNRVVWGSPMPLDPGRYTFSAYAPGKKVWTHAVDVGSDGSKIDVNVPALEDDRSTGALVATSAGASSADETRSGSLQRTAGYLVAGLGVIGTGVAAGFGLKVLSQMSERDAICPTDECTSAEYARIQTIQMEAQPNATAFNVAISLGGAALLGGAILLLTAPSDRSRATSPVHFTPWAGPTTAGGSIAGRF